MGLKEQAISGVLWNSIGKFSSMGIEFVVGIILARLLTPKEFGLIGTIMVVIALSQVFINSGFSQALVRKQNCTQEDYSTVFFFNLAVGFFLFIVLFFSADYISRFYNNHELKPLLQVLAIGLIISSLTIIQSAKLTKKIDFKLQTKISVIASIMSGIIAVIMALMGFGVWSLVVKSLTYQAINSSLLWVSDRWKPNLIFSVSSFKELFGFGSKLLLSGLIGTFFTNIYYIAIGKYFSAVDLGFYTRAELFRNLPSQNVTDIATGVAYPVLAKVQNDPVQLRAGLQRIITITFFIVAVLMFGMASVAHSLVLTLIGVQWKQSAIYLQMLCILGLMFPLNTINMNLLNVVGRSDLFLKLQFISQLLTIPVIILGVIFGIKFMIAGMCFNSLLAYLYVSKVSSKFSGYKLRDQLLDIMKPLLLATFMGLVVFVVDYLTNFAPMVTLVLQVTVGATIVFFCGEVFRLKEYMLIKSIIVEQYKKMV
jgi:teichuronic acid exporter